MLPKYYRQKIYNDDQREQLWINKINNPTKWVLGQQVDTNKTMKNYIELIKAARIKNQKLNYGSSKINVDKQQQENKRRTQLLKIRTDNTTPSARSNQRARI